MDTITQTLGSVDLRGLEIFQATHSSMETFLLASQIELLLQNASRRRGVALVHNSDLSAQFSGTDARIVTLACLEVAALSALVCLPVGLSLGVTTGEVTVLPSGNVCGSTAILSRELSRLADPHTVLCAGGVPRLELAARSTRRTVLTSDGLLDVTVLLARRDALGVSPGALESIAERSEGFLPLLAQMWDGENWA